MQRWILLFLLGLLSACQSVTGEDAQFGLQRDLEAYSTEAAALREDMQVQRTAVVTTSEAAGTEAAVYRGYNQQLIATLYVLNPPTPTGPAVVANAQGPLPLSMYDLSDGMMRFVQVGTAGQITPDDRCFVSHQSFFTPQSNVIYTVAFALNLQAGTQVRVDWQYGGDIVHTSAYVAPQFAEGQCIALELRPSNTEFLPGNWTATLYINGEALDPISFTITGG